LICLELPNTLHLDPPLERWACSSRRAAGPYVFKGLCAPPSLSQVAAAAVSCALRSARSARCLLTAIAPIEIAITQNNRRI
jgi:hypothetical protein